MPNKISVITPFLNGLDLLPDYEQATMGAELILIDNGSEPETAQALASLPHERGMVIRNETNLGFAAANNQGYARATGDIIVFLNSDVAGDPSWMRLVADDVKDGALYGPSVQRQLVYGIWLPYVEGWCVAATRATWEQLVDRLYNEAFEAAFPPDATADEMIRVRDELQATFGDKRRMVIMPSNARPEFIQLSVPGPWDAVNYPGPYWEDNDLCFRALGQNISLVPTAWPIQHKGGRSAGPIVSHGDTFERNRATFAARVKPVWERMQRVS